MFIVWGEQEYLNAGAIATALLPPDETPAGIWDTWDFRGLYNQPLAIASGQPPNNLPITYPIPWQIFPR